MPLFTRYIHNQRQIIQSSLEKVLRFLVNRNKKKKEYFNSDVCFSDAMSCVDNYLDRSVIIIHYNCYKLNNV